MAAVPLAVILDDETCAAAAAGRFSDKWCVSLDSRIVPKMAPPRLLPIEPATRIPAAGHWAERTPFHAMTRRNNPPPAPALIKPIIVRVNPRDNKRSNIRTTSNDRTCSRAA